MKLVFSLIFMINISYAGRIKIIHSQNESKTAQLIQARLIQEYELPRQLIQTELNSKCPNVTNLKKDSDFMMICVKDNKDFYVIPNKNIELIKSSFNVFYKGKKNDL